MTQAEPAPKPAERSRDPLAVALANASLLGGGYLMLGRRALAITTTLVTAELLIIFASSAQVLWFAFVLIGWWLALVAHGWLLAGGWPHRRRPRPCRPGRQRAVALAFVLPVLLAAVLLRLDAGRIDREVSAARRASDCQRVETAVGRVSPAHRMVALSPGSDGTGLVAACATVRRATADLDGALNGELTLLERGFQRLAAVREESPDYAATVTTALNRFLDSLPVDDPCDTADILTWLEARPAGDGEPDRVAEVVPRLAPAALLNCADRTLAAGERDEAYSTYQRLIDQYPGHELAARARQKTGEIGQAVELERVRASLRASSSDSLPAYCSAPAAYPAAPGGGLNRALIFGSSTYVGKLPAEWKATGATDAARVVCIGTAEYGSAAESCRYDGVGSVTYHRVALPVRVYELRTGRLVTDTWVEISGTSCPYFIYGDSTKRLVSVSDAGVVAALRPVAGP
ncbi:hypothetical protein UG55_108815 [Frankia sp. EI5c]|uniref:hypothetical protein n=1 Tax=Frankia sp. EI5c TaxID=683316 RepID=UPI0007C266FB|nr:hypothetical protein [Frankia sp. EI5c]OAA19611.1 hypothetical protein UG55_108815 [Frankia sp. EI5c]